MKTKVIDRNGVEMAGPDEVGLAPEGSVVVMAPVGGVSPAQAGILETRPRVSHDSGQITATPSKEMIDRGHAAAPGLDRGTVEDILNAALGVRRA